MKLSGLRSESFNDLTMLSNYENELSLILTSNFRRTNSYQRHWTLEKIQIFEFLLHCSLLTGPNFIVLPVNVLSKCARTDDHTTWKALDYFISKDYLTVSHLVGHRQIHNTSLYLFKINYKQIIPSLDKIYNLGGESWDKAQILKGLKDFFLKLEEISNNSYDLTRFKMHLNEKEDVK